MILARLRPTRIYTHALRTMSSVSQFVSAAVNADPSLAGASDKDKAAITQLEAETEGLAKDLSKLNEKLNPLTYLYSNAPSSADISLYCHLHPSIAAAPSSQHPSQPSVLRYFLQIQSLPPVHSAQSALPNAFPPLDIDITALPTPPRQVIAPVKKEKKAKAPAGAAAAEGQQQGEGIVAAVTAGAASAAAAVGDAVAAAKDAIVGGGKDAKKEAKEAKKKEKKEKPAKAPVAKEEPAAPAPSMIDMRVGKVLEVSKHPDADSLYIEKIDVGEAEPRTICSGLVKYMKEEDILGQSLVIIANLKPVKMRGVTSQGMVLCASAKDGKDAGGIEFVSPPEGSQPGERIYFEGEKYENGVPEAVLNPKKKIWEMFQPDFVTTSELEAAWIDPATKSVHRMRTKDGVCKSKTLVGASLS
ncbi:putative tRNA binding protein [Papiliotrema laurentii]|uniref:tRNA binding protein n=1 Tax=Papiliotrema laurentii TaxID=5418 RepID=A0AAD9FNS5_PAPLA|nr:putative tRNA binding protein [Papiliotrema laurentii]